MKIFLKIILISAFIVSFRQTYSQSDSIDKKDYFTKKVKVVAGAGYEMSGFGELFLGKHWRDLWTTPFEADVLDLNKFAGGLTPYKRGGGLQTKSLRMKGKDGKTYKFRSINKDPTRILPPDLQNTIVADAFQDQISTSNPLSAIIVASMLTQLGIINAVPIVVYMPDDPLLGEYRKDFGNVLGTLEENPEEGEDGEKGFGESDKILNSGKFYKKLEKDNDVQIDDVEFLKARLFDLMIGDWDRHSDQWLWAGYEKDGKLIFKPIPRDRDQAFCLYDGIVPFFVGEYVTQIEGYGEDYPRIYDLSWNGRYVDRRFLSQASKKDYDSIAALIQSKITDEIITKSVKQLPEEWYKLEGKNLINMIKSRRDKLNEAADEYYDLLNEVVDIYGSDKKEFIEINNLNDDKVEVKIYKLDKETNEKKGEPFFNKIFDADDTDELRIYVNEGKDVLNVKGENNSGIDVKIIKDKEKLEVKGNGEGIEIYKDTRPVNDLKERYEPFTEDRGHEWRFSPVFNYDTDNGLELGGGPVLYKYGFRAKPYVYRMSLMGSYAFNAPSYNFKYTGDFYTIIKNTRISLEVLGTQLAITRYFGEGNQTPYSDSLQDIKYYNVKQELFRVAPTFYIPAGKRSEFTITPFYKLANVSEDQNTLLGQNPDTYGIGRISFAGLNSSFVFDTRDNKSEPFKGIYAQLLGNYTPNLFVNNYGFSKAGVDIRAYFSTDTVKGVTFAFRAGTGKVWGNFPFYESMFLGGANSLKGFSRERFAGDAVVLGETEIRFGIAKVNLLVPGVFGISVFGGAGRVFLDSEDSKVWHSSFGSTLWISYLSRMFNVGVTVAKSDEGLNVFIGSGLYL
ncbi:MAG TPA: BamA/TamA family outer membrane protein [Ignavibacteria bacterium]|nr:BamA/TamA family outer membrane protein [Ignavibacteria bacterium]